MLTSCSATFVDPSGNSSSTTLTKPFRLERAKPEDERVPQTSLLLYFELLLTKSKLELPR